MPVRGDGLAGGAAAHADDDGAVFDGVGHARRCRRVRPWRRWGWTRRGWLGVVAHGGPVALVAGVEQAAEVLVAVGLRAEDGVGLVDEQGRRVARLMER